MRSFLAVLPLVLALSRLCPAQKPALPPQDKVALAKSEFEDARQAWIKNDPKLEEDFALGKGDPAAMRERIRRAADLQHVVAEKEIAYYDLIISHTEAGRNEPAQTAPATVPVETKRKLLVDELALIQADIADRDARLKALSEGDRDWRRLYEDQLANRRKQADRIAAQLRTLDELGNAQAEGPSRVQEITQGTGEVLKNWEKIRADEVEEAARFKDYYSAMERNVENRIAAGAPKSRSRAAGKGSKSASQGVANPADVAGAWIGSPGTQGVTLVLRLEGDTLRGTYTVRLAGPGGPQDIQLPVEGKVQPRAPIRLHWTSRNPAAAGDIELSLGSDGHLSVNRHRTSGEAAIPDAVETLLRKP
jgi:hypothetical protein